MARLLDRILKTNKKPSPAPLTLVFQGTVQSGMGMYSELTFPGKDQVSQAPEDWPSPAEMVPGSLNCNLDTLPDYFDQAAGDGYMVQKLDSGHFAPAFTIPGKLIENNMLKPHTGSDPRRGDAQIWRCAVENLDTGISFDAWLVRRIESAYYDIIELMSDEKLRKTYDLKDGTPIKVTAFAGP